MWRSTIRRKYGISEQQYLELAGDPPRCAICGCERSIKQRLCVDHCHNKKEIRGILCQRCNSGLERLELFPDWPERARAYLQNAKSIPIRKKNETATSSPVPDLASSGQP
jgi:hypothetical protein